MAEKEISVKNPARRTWTVIFILISLAFLAGGHFYFRTEAKRIRQEKYQSLAVIGELKAGLIAGWRKERLGDASNLAGSPFFRKAVEEWLGSPENPILRELILKRLDLPREVYGYTNVLLLNPDGRILLAAKEDPDPVGAVTKRAMEEAIAGRKAVLSDLYRSPSGIICLDSVAPILDAGDGPLGVLVLKTDAQTFLYPLIQSWPTPSRSAETYLIRMEGEEVVFLNELRHRAGAALSLRLPLSQADLPEAEAALGKKGIFEGEDYRGVKVLADLRPVPGSDWFMVAKVDASEILAEMRYRAGIAILFVTFLILLAAAVTSLGYRQQQARLYRSLYKSEKEQREAQEELHTTLYSIGDAVITTDKRGQVKVMNPVAERLTGWSEAEARGKPLAEVFHIINEETRTDAEDPVQRVLREGIVVGLANHTVLVSRDGREIPIADAGAPVRDESGVITGVVLVFRDQTKERQAQEALRASEEKYRILHEFAGEPIFTYYTDLKLMELNKAACDYIGGVRKELLGKDIFELGILHPDDLDRATVSIQKILSRAKSLAVDKLRFKGKHGLYGTFQVTATPVLRNGEIVAITNVCRDVTLEEQLYSALEASEKRYKFLFNAGNDAQFVYGLTTDTKPEKFVEVNDLACTMTGYSREELLGLTPLDLIVPEEIEQVYKSQQILSEKKHRVFERTLITKEGGRIPCEISSHLFELNGVPTVLAIVRDITERKKAEEDLRAALKEKDIMLLEIHHRVKNNMQIMSSLLRLQARQISDEKAQEAFSESQTRIHSMAMIHEKLYQSKDFSSIDFAGYIDKMITHLFVVYQVESKRIRFKMDMPSIEIDINRAIPCGLIVNELVSNALKYAFPKEKKGELTVRMFKDESSKYHLTVKDTGVGFPESIDIQKPQTLGLQIVNDLTNQLDGKLELRREGGTEFEITF